MAVLDPTVRKLGNSRRRFQPPLPRALPCMLPPCKKAQPKFDQAAELVLSSTCELQPGAGYGQELLFSTMGLSQTLPCTHQDLPTK
jgi:hypothetical protein